MLWSDKTSLIMREGGEGWRRKRERERVDRETENGEGGGGGGGWRVLSYRGL